MATALQADFPELAHLSREDLEDLLVDPTYFQAVFHSLPRVRAMYAAQAELGMGNEQIAHSNLALQDGLYALRTETQAAFDEAKRLQSRWAELEKEQKEVYQRFSPQFLLMRLRHATTALDDQSEAVATAFVQSNSHTTHSYSLQPSGTGTPPQSSKDIDDFVKEFKELRKTYHKRVMWSERWADKQVLWIDD